MVQHSIPRLNLNFPFLAARDEFKLWVKVLSQWSDKVAFHKIVPRFYFAYIDVLVLDTYHILCHTIVALR